jgi:CubicO group peptidase (beta-lactamase class C family)
MDPKTPQPRSFACDWRQDPALRQVEVKTQLGRTAIAGGYRMEILLPWNAIGVQPQVGRHVAFQVYVDDTDPGRASAARLTWYPSTQTHMDRTAMYELRLDDRADPPVRMAGVAQYEDYACLRVDVLAAPDLAGKTVTLRQGTRSLAQGTLAAADGRAQLILRAPMPPRDQWYDDLGLYAGGQPPVPLPIENGAEGLGKAVLRLRPTFESHVFSGEAFPPCRFEQPLLARTLLGDYILETSFYDSAYHPVTSAATPGRYGAVVQVKAADGRRLTRYATLFRLPQTMDWYSAQLGGSVTLPVETGIDPQVAGQATDLADLLKVSLADRDQRSDAVAVLLASLSQRTAAAAVTPNTDAAAANVQWWAGLKRKLSGADTAYPPFDRPLTTTQPARVLRAGTTQEAGMTERGMQIVDQVLQSWAADSDEPFDVCIARHGVIVLHKAYGFRDGKPMTTDTPSRMASLTKLLGGTCMMMAVDQNLIDLDARVDQYLCEFQNVPVVTPLTVRHLYTHTAGMWDHWGDDQADLEQQVAEYYPLLHVGQKYDYNGMSLALGARVLERVTGESLPTVYARRLFGPLGLRHTTAATASWDAQSTAYDMAVVGQMLLNGGSYGSYTFMSPATRDRMLPTSLERLLPGIKAEIGIGTVWFRDGLGRRTFAHAAASQATLRIDLDNDLVVSMCRNAGGRNFQKYHPMFLKAVADAMEGARDLVLEP